MSSKNVDTADVGNLYSKFFNYEKARNLLKNLRRATMNKNKFVAGATGTIITLLGQLLSALDNPNCPAALKGTIIGGIGYILLPLDVIPDAMPVVGYTDDIGIATAVLKLVASYADFSLADLDKEIKAEAQNKPAMLEQAVENTDLSDIPDGFFLQGIKLTATEAEPICGLLVYIAGCDGLVGEEEVIIQSMLDFYGIKKSPYELLKCEPDFERIRSILPPKEYLSLFRTCCTITLADKQITAEEISVLEKIAYELSIPNYQHILSEVKQLLHRV